MPLVRIDLLEGRSPEERAAIGAAVHEAMTETIDVPDDGVYQVITEHPAGGVRFDPHYLGVERDEGTVFVHMTMRRGRSDGDKRALYARMTALLEERARVEPRNVLIVLAENELIDWSFGNGEAQIA